MNKIKTSEPKLLWKLRCTLGEGTLWVSEHNSIYFVDIKKKKICSFNIKNKKKRTFKVNKEIGFIAHIKDHIFILGLQGELRIQNLKSKKIFKSIEKTSAKSKKRGGGREKNNTYKKTSNLFLLLSPNSSCKLTGAR